MTTTSLSPPEGERPETDAYVKKIGGSVNEFEDNFIHADFARSLERRLREALEQLRIAKEDGEIHLEAANRWSERAERAEAELERMAR